MFMGYSLGEIGSIFAMQAFAGLILFSVFVLMALGLAIIFGQMGVINMAHGEFTMILGAYILTSLTSHLFQTYAPQAFAGYFFVAMLVAFILSGAIGLAVEWLLIKRLYKRPLDTLLATWGLSLIMQQAFRSASSGSRGWRATARYDDGLAAGHGGTPCSTSTISVLPMVRARCCTTSIFPSHPARSSLWLGATGWANRP